MSSPLHRTLPGWQCPQCNDGRCGQQLLHAGGPLSTALLTLSRNVTKLPQLPVLDVSGHADLRDSQAVWSLPRSVGVALAPYIKMRFATRIPPSPMSVQVHQDVCLLGAALPAWFSSRCPDSHADLVIVISFRSMGKLESLLAFAGDADTAYSLVQAWTSSFFAQLKMAWRL